jgi:hypothetical protein
MNLILPFGLDLKAVETAYPPQFPAYKTDKLAYILHTLATIPVFNKNTELFDDYVPMSSKLLEFWVDNYKQHLDYAIETGIIAVHPSEKYSKGKFCKHYQFTAPFRNLGASYTLTDVCLIRKIKRFAAKRKIHNKNYDYLNKWFNPSLKIDIDLVQAFLEEEWSFKHNFSDLRDYSIVKEKHKSPYQQYEYSKLSAQFLHSGQFRSKVDDLVYRYHSNLTNMRGIIRNALTYEGKQLVAVDISNSQPYLSLLLLDVHFWERFYQILAEKQKKYKKNSEPHDYFSFFLYKFIKEMDRRINKGLKKDISITSIIMLVESMLKLLNTMDEDEFIVYRDKVCKGKLYDYLLLRFQEHYKLYTITRDDAKVAVLQAFFSDNRFLAHPKAKPKLMFKQEFGGVYQVLATIKRVYKELLPILLQNIESYLVIEIIAKRISKEHPEMPLFTIHDSLVTTVGNEHILQRIMTEELTRYVGHAPHLKPPEYWEPENLCKHLNKLKGKLSA